MTIEYTCLQKLSLKNLNLKKTMNRHLLGNTDFIFKTLHDNTMRNTKYTHFSNDFYVFFITGTCKFRSNVNKTAKSDEIKEHFSC